VDDLYVNYEIETKIIYSKNPDDLEIGEYVDFTSCIIGSFGECLN